MILPYIDQTALYESADFNTYWQSNALVNGVRNRDDISRKMITSLLCPSDPNARKYNAASAPFNYMLSAGPVSDWSRRNGPGPFSLKSSKRSRDFTDGMSNTILMGEGVVGGEGGHNNTDVPGFRNHAAGRLQGATGTQHTREWDSSPANLTTINNYFDACVTGASGSNHGDNDRANRNWAAGRTMLGPWFNTLMPPNSGANGQSITTNCDNNGSATDQSIKNASSHHTGGAHVLMADGAVRFATENIDQAVWIDAGSINGGEVNGEF